MSAEKRAARKKLRTYKKKVRKSTLYKKNKKGKLQKKIDIKARKRKLGLGKKKIVQKRINKLSQKKKLVGTGTKKFKGRVKTPLYKTKKKK